MNEANLRGLGEFLLLNNLNTYSSGGRGRAVIISNEQWEQVWAPEDADLLVVRSRKMITPITVTCLYLSPNIKCLSFEQAQEIINAHHNHVKRNNTDQHILMGDVNCRNPMWGGLTSCQQGKFLANSLRHNGFGSAVRVCQENWTRQDPVHGTKSWIDILMVNHKLGKRIIKSGVKPVEKSDHRMLWATIRNQFNDSRYINIRARGELAKNADLSFLDQESRSKEEIIAKCTRIEEVMREIDKESEKKTPIGNNPIKTELAHTKRKYKRKLTKLAKKVRKNGVTSEMAREIIKTKRMMERTKRRLRKEKQRVAKKKRSSKAEQNPWRAINRIMGRNFLKMRLGKIDDEICYKDQLVKEEEFARRFTDQEMGPEEAGPLVTSENLKLTGREIEEVKSLIKKKACNFDTGLSCTVLSELLEHHDRRIIGFIMECLSKRFIPRNIKTARISLIPKPNGKLRPISILHPLYRIFDACTFMLIKRELKYDKFVIQYGFLEKCGTLDTHLAIKKVIDSIRLKGDKNPWIWIAIDLSEAFDKISYDAIYGGATSIGISQKTRTLIRCLITERRSKISTSEGTKWIMHDRGTPQGGFCSPILFGMGLELLGKINSENFRLISYADDLNIVARGEPDTPAWSKIEAKLEKIVQALGRMGLTVNPEKSEAMQIGAVENRITNSLRNSKINIGGKAVSIHNNIKLLGCELKRTSHKNEEGVRTVTIRGNNNLIPKLKRLRTKLIPFSCKIRSLNMNQTNLLLSSLIMGLANYYGVRDQIWDEWETSERIGREAMEIIGNIIKEGMDLKRNMKNNLLAYILLKRNITISMNESLHNYMLKRDRQKKNEIICEVARPRLNPYKIKIIQPSINAQWMGKDLVTACKRSHEGEIISYKRKRIENDLWIECELTNENGMINSDKYNFWTPNESYLDVCETALALFIEKNLILLKRSKSLHIESDLALQMRISNPLKISQLACILHEHFDYIYFLRRSRRWLQVEQRDKATIPRLVSVGSTQYWNLLDILDHFKARDTAMNLAEECLHTIRMHSLDWKRMKKSDLYGIFILGGGWRIKSNENSCPMCGAVIDTLGILVGACSHIPGFKSGKRRVTKDNVHTFFNNLRLIRSLSFFVSETSRAILIAKCPDVQPQFHEPIRLPSVHQQPPTIQPTHPTIDSSPTSSTFTIINPPTCK